MQDSIIILLIVMLYFIILKHCTVWKLSVLFQPIRLFSLSLVIKKLVDFELPYVSLRSSEVENFQVGLRKWWVSIYCDRRYLRIS